VRRKNETADLCSERRTRRGGVIRRQTSNNSDDSENSGDGREINTMDIKYLVSLSCKLKRAQERVTSAQLRWKQLMEHSRLFSALMDDGMESMMSNDEGGDNGGTNANLLSPSSSTPKCCHKLRYSLQRLWIRCLRYPTYRSLSLITFVLSAFVLLSEVTLAAPLNLSPFSWTLHAHSTTTTTQIPPLKSYFRYVR